MDALWSLSFQPFIKDYMIQLAGFIQTEDIIDGVVVRDGRQQSVLVRH